MTTGINRINEMLAIRLTKAFGTVGICHAFMAHWMLPAFSLSQRHQAAFLYRSNWVQPWSLPLIPVGTNVLGRDAEKRSKLDHEKLAKSCEEKEQTPREVIR